MKYLSPSVIVLALYAASCASQGEVDVRHQLAATMVAATSPKGPGGDQVTSGEQAQLEQLIAQLQEDPGLDWLQIATGVGAALVSMLPLLGLLPNRFIIGHQEAKALNKAAGFPS